VALLLSAVLFSLGYALRHTLSCFLLSFVLAYLLDPVLSFLERHKVRRTYGLILLYSILAILILLFVTFFAPFLTRRWHALVNGLPGYLQKGKDMALSLRAQYQYGSEWSWIVENVTTMVDKLIVKAGDKLYVTASRMAFSLLNLVLAPILVFFMLFYKKEIQNGIVSWLPHSRQHQFMDLGHEINTSVGGYIRGQIMVSAIVAVLSAAALFYLDIDYPLFNGLFAGLASVLPFIGVIIATIPALFFAYVKFETGAALLKVIGAFSVIYFIEGYLIKPLVFKQSMNLNPLLTIIIVMAFGELMGFWGILLAIPIAAAAKIVLQHVRRGEFSGEA
jgi:putative permease